MGAAPKLRTAKEAAASIGVHHKTLPRWIAAAVDYPGPVPWTITPTGQRMWHSDADILNWCNEVERWRASTNAAKATKFPSRNSKAEVPPIESTHSGVTF